ncbi:hypothetical protein N665_0344s0003 [Sinapis alba]|nr:hypothetical protein N665_0344s0003 [Sinapis alba]
MWEELERSPILVIAKLAERKSAWSGRTVHYLLCRQLRVHKKEIWSLVVDQPISLAYTNCFEKRKWLGLLLLQAMGLYALHHNSRIPFESAKRVFDDEAMMSYPWDGRSYTISGMKDMLLVWAYESVSCFGERFGRVVEKVDIPLLRWGGKRTHASFATLFSKEMREHGEVSEAVDPQLVNLITDIHADKFVGGFWEVKGNEKKKKVKGEFLSEAEPPTKKHKKVKKQIVSLTNEEEGSGEMVNNALLVNIMSTLENIFRKFDHHEGRFETIESRSLVKVLGVKKNLAEDFASGATTPATEVKENLIEDFASGAATPDKADKDAALDFLYISPAKVDKDGKAAKAAKDAKAATDGKDEAGQALGPDCRGKPKDHDAKKAAELKRKAAELKKQESTVKKEAELKKQKVTQIKKEKVAGTDTPPRANVIRVKFKNPSEQDSSLVEVTDEIRARENELLPESDVEEEELIRSARIKEYREISVQFSLKGCALMVVSSAPIFPYIGDNRMTCMRKNFQPSSAVYDPLAPVDPAKFEKLISTDYEGDFYIILMKERPWSDREYGWLFDNHVAAYMKVLIGRFMRDPTPLWSKRIAFIDPWFLTLWVHDFKQFKINPNLMKFKGTGYEDLTKGRIPSYFQTNLKWFEDVDHLYGVLQEKIDCYDPIIGQVTEEIAFKPLSQMLHVMLNDIVPANLRKPSKKQFAFRRRKGKYIPKNTQVGDCGVYSLKFIKCLAIGVTFDGINDENIQGLRPCRR